MNLLTKTPTLIADPPAQRGGESLEESLMEELPEMVAPVAVSLETRTLEGLAQ